MLLYTSYDNISYIIWYSTFPILYFTVGIIYKPIRQTTERRYQVDAPSEKKRKIFVGTTRWHKKAHLILHLYCTSAYVSTDDEDYKSRLLKYVRLKNLRDNENYLQALQLKVDEYLENLKETLNQYRDVITFDDELENIDTRICDLISNMSTGYITARSQSLCKILYQKLSKGQIKGKKRERKPVQKKAVDVNEENNSPNHNEISKKHCAGP